MPQLRSGARRSKRIGDLQQGAAQPVEEAENIAQNRTTRRKTGGGRGRGRGNAAAVGKGRPAGGRGRGGAKLIDLDAEPPCDVVPNAVVEPVANGVGDNNIGMEGGSADRIVGVEEEGNATPVPDRVIFNI